MNLINKIKEGIGMKDKNMQRKINVRFPDRTGDTNRSMTIQELKDGYSGCMLVDPRTSEKVEILDLTNLDKGIEEVIAMPGLRGG